MTVINATVDSLAHGGRGVAHVDGRVTFIDGAVPGDVVALGGLKPRRRFATAAVTAVVQASPDRVDPPCPVFDRCGGCDWQMISLPAQRRWKADIVASQIAHLGGLAHPPVEETMAVGPGFGYRNRIDLRVAAGRPALYAARSHDPVPIDHCPLVLGPISELIRQLQPTDGVDRVTLRASAVTGQTLELHRRSGRWDRGRIHEVVAGRRFQITDRAFFQVNTAGAELLVRLVRAALEVGASDTLLDGYAGGGLFSATVGSAARHVVAVESDRVALEDLAVNAPEATVLPGEFAALRLPAVDKAVVDPPRTGLGVRGVEVLVGAKPAVICFVSCDPASLARDVGLFCRAGYRLESVTPVDMFPQTHHVEAVARLTR